MKTYLNNQGSLAKGFSLVEMLVVITVIAVIAAIAIPNIGSMNDAATTAKSQRNGQSLAAVYANALAAGNTAIYPSKTAAIKAMIAGVSGTGLFASQTFKVPGMSPDEAAASSVYLDNNMAYFSAGGQTAVAAADLAT